MKLLIAENDPSMRAWGKRVGAQVVRNCGRFDLFPHCLFAFLQTLRAFNGGR